MFSFCEEQLSYGQMNHKVVNYFILCMEIKRTVKCRPKLNSVLGKTALGNWVFYIFLKKKKDPWILILNDKGRHGFSAATCKHFCRNSTVCIRMVPISHGRKKNKEVLGKQHQHICIF